jgi:hypothetical protein
MTRSEVVRVVCIPATAAPYVILHFGYGSRANAFASALKGRSGFFFFREHANACLSFIEDRNNMYKKEPILRTSWLHTRAKKRETDYSLTILASPSRMPLAVSKSLYSSMMVLASRCVVYCFWAVRLRGDFSGACQRDRWLTERSVC